MRNKSWKRRLMLAVTVVAGFAVMVLPQAVFAAQEPEPELPVGGWEPVEVIYLPEDVDIEDEIKISRNVINSDADSVFTKGASTVGYEALESEAQKKYYRALESMALDFVSDDSDIEIMTLSGYKEYVIAIMNFTNAGVSSSDEALKVFYAFDYDHPAYYWLSNKILSSSTSLYICTEEEYADGSTRQELNSLVSSGVKTYANIAESGEDTLDKVSIVHDKIVNTINYAYDGDGIPESAKWAHSVQGVFDPEHHLAVCEGYADTFALIMNYLGIQNCYIVGTADGSGAGGGGGHAWNAVSADGGDTYMYMDLTWDDFKDNGYAYTYFGMPKTDFEKTHYKYNSGSAGSKWLYDINVDLNDSFEGTFYKAGGFYYDGSTDVGELVSAGIAKASRSGGYVSFMAPNTSRLRSVANELGVGLSYYILSYKGTNYYYMIAKLEGMHVHAWGDPEYTWSADNGTVTALHVCQEPNCNVEMEAETVDTTSRVVSEANCTEPGVIEYRAEFKKAAFGVQTKNVETEALGHDFVEHPAAAATCEADGSIAYSECLRCGKLFDGAGNEISEADTVVPALGGEHKPAKAVKENIVDPTCTLSGGFDDVVYCSVCGAEISREHNETNALGHSWKTVKVAAGLLKNGQQYDQCTVCGEKQNVKTIAGYATYYVKSFKVKAGKKSLTAKWKKQTAAKQKKFNGYQVRYSLKSNMSGAKKVTAKKSSSSKVIKKLKKGKRYYVQVRTYTKKGGVTFYSKWSAKKSVKVK